MALRVKIAALLITAAALSAGLVGWLGIRLTTRVLEENVLRRLVAVREARAVAVESYLERLRGQLAAVAALPEVGEAAAAFEDAVRVAGATDAATQAEAAALLGFYTDEFLSRLGQVDPAAVRARDRLEAEAAGAADPVEVLAGATPPGGTRYLPRDAAAVLLQAAYIADNPYPPGSKEELVDSPDAPEAYAAAHNRYHPRLRFFADLLDAYDLFLVDTQRRQVVYSVEKETDFGTSLSDGPYASSGLADVVAAALALPDGPGAAVLAVTDFAPYGPSYNEPAAFLAARIYGDPSAAPDLDAATPPTTPDPAGEPAIPLGDDAGDLDTEPGAGAGGNAADAGAPEPPAVTPAASDAERGAATQAVNADAAAEALETPLTRTLREDRIASGENSPPAPLGVLVIQIPIEGIDNLTTDHQRWTGDGLGRTGEAYLVGADGLLRSNARAFLETPAAYLTGLDEPVAERVRLFDSTVLSPPSHPLPPRAPVDGAARPDTGAGDGAATDAAVAFTGPVLMTHRPLELDGLDWRIAVVLDREEAFASIERFRGLLVWTTLSIAALAGILAALLAGHVLKPIGRLTEAVARAAAGDVTARVPVRQRGRDELDELGRRFNTMVEEMAVREVGIRRAAIENERLLQNVLPERITRRLQAGEQQIADRHTRVAVVVAEFAGLAACEDNLPPAETVSLLSDLFAAFGDVAARYGVERIRTSGDSFFAACGLDGEGIGDDPAHQAVKAAMALLHVVARFNSSQEPECLEALCGPIKLRVGVAYGPVTAGIIGRQRFVYDLLGRTVSLAFRLETEATPGTVRVSQAVRDALADTYPFRPRGSAFDLSPSS